MFKVKLISLELKLSLKAASGLRYLPWAARLKNPSKFRFLIFQVLMTFFRLERLIRDLPITFVLAMVSSCRLYPETPGAIEYPAENLIVHHNCFLQEY